MHGLFQNARDLLRESAMLGGSAPPQGLFQVVGHVCANENSLTIRHLQPLFQGVVSASEALECVMPSEVEQVYKPNSVLRFEI